MPWRQPGRVVGRGGNAKYWSLGTLGAMLERSGTAKSLRFPRKRSLTTTMQGRLCLSMSSRSPSTRSKKSWGWIRSSPVAPLHTKRGPHRCRPLQVGDILRLAAPRRPRRLNVHVSRTLKAAASGKQFIPRKVAFNAHSSHNNTRWAVTPGRYPPIFIGVSRSIHIVMGVYPKGNQINTPITKEFSIPTQ